MAATYGQLKDGKRITYQEFETEVKRQLAISEFNVKLCKKAYNKGFSVSDARSYLIMHSN